MLFFGASVVEQPTPPPLLERALPQLPGVRLLDPTVDLVGYTVDELKSFGYWPPWITTDVDRDGLSDVVSVVVKPGAWYLWSGRAYEADLYAVGERIAIATHERDQTLGSCFR